LKKKYRNAVSSKKYQRNTTT